MYEAETDQKLGIPVHDDSLQSEIARALDASVMTLHRWRKTQARDPIAQLQHENSLLRRLVTDLLLEKISSKPGMTSRRKVTKLKR